MQNNGIITKEHYFDPWNDLSDEEQLFYLEDDQEKQENQKALLLVYVQQLQNKKKSIERENKIILKKLNKYGVKSKSDVKFMSENSIFGREPTNEEEKHLFVTRENHEESMDPALKSWYNNDLEIIENKKNIKTARKKIKKLDKGVIVASNFVGKF